MTAWLPTCQRPASPTSTAGTGPCVTCRRGRVLTGGWRAGTGRSALAAAVSLLVVAGAGMTNRGPPLGRPGRLDGAVRLGALAMRGAGCTWNDIVDRKIDAQVERTRGRPLPSGELKLHQALGWFAIQLAVGAAILFKLNKFAGGIALALPGPGRDLSDDEAADLVAAGRARPRLQLGRPGGIRHGDRHAHLAAGRALCRRRRLDDGLRHDLRHAGPARRRHRRRALDGAALRQFSAPLARAVRGAGAGAVVAVRRARASAGFPISPCCWRSPCTWAGRSRPSSPTTRPIVSPSSKPTP